MTTSALELTQELQQAVSGFFQRIPFNRMLGIQLGELSPQRVTMHLPMKPELIGNFLHGILHGGVISSLLDVAGGAMALIGAFDKHQHLSSAERMARLSKLGTIDLRRLPAPRARPALHRQRRAAAFRQQGRGGAQRTAQ